jgi:hypothetical protein
MATIQKYRPLAGQLNLLARPIGVELEYSSVIGFKEHVNRAVNFAFWEHDGTLTKGGEELVFQPASGDVLMQYLTTIIGLHENFPPKVDQSCGFHVHVQSQDFTMLELRRIIAMWCRIERDIFGTLVLSSRRKGRDDGHHYCRPMTVDEGQRYESWQFTPADVTRLMRKRLLEVTTHSTSTPNERINAFLMKKLYELSITIEPIKVVPMPQTDDPKFAQKYNDYKTYQMSVYHAASAKQNFNHIKAYKRTNGGAGGCRYCAMNVHSHFFRGTIEFRLKEGTLDPTEIIFWPLFCGWFVEAAIRLRDDEVMAITSLADWVKTMRDNCIAQPSVLNWVEEKMAKKEKT